MDESERLRDIVRWRRKPEPGGAVRLGNVVRQLMDNRISPQQTRLGAVPQLWSRLLPSELCRHCKIVDISGGLLKVMVDSPAYMYELRLCSAELLEELQQQCPRAKIKEIKFVIGR